MATLKKIATAGLIMALAVPTVVYGADKAGYSQPIKDIKGQQTGMFSCEKIQRNGQKKLS